MARFKGSNLWLPQNTEIISATKTLSITDKQQQFLDPNGSDRDVNLPTDASSAGLSFWVINIGSENLVIKNNAGTQTILTVGSGEIGYVTNDGNGWRGSLGSTGATGATGGTGTDGADGATGGTGGTGAAGSDGTIGQDGDTGGTGGTGDAGVDGSTGGTGATGARGEGFRIDESISDFAEDDVARIEGMGGITVTDVYIVTIYNDNRSDKSTPIDADLTQHIVMYDGNTWYDWGQFIGDTGGTGNTGAQGDVGGTGGTGGTGEIGPTLTGGTGGTGDAGVDGATGGTGGTGDAGVDGATGGTGATGGVGSVSGIKTGSESLSSGVQSINVTFGEAMANTNYKLTYSLLNTTDANPSSYTSVVTAKTTTGFTIQLSGQTDSANYVLEWVTTDI